MSSSRLGLRFFANSRAAFRNSFRQNGSKGFRFQSTEASAAGAEPQSVFQKMWNSPVGVKTVHFWYTHTLSLSREDYVEKG
jgi:mitochondrial pyruvate carrier 2